jgi:hypothetical protein
MDIVWEVAGKVFLILLPAGLIYYVLWLVVKTSNEDNEPTASQRLFKLLVVIENNAAKHGYQMRKLIEEACADTRQYFAAIGSEMVRQDDAVVFRVALLALREVQLYDLKLGNPGMSGSRDIEHRRNLQAVRDYRCFVGAVKALRSEDADIRLNSKAPWREDDPADTLAAYSKAFA